MSEKYHHSTKSELNFECQNLSLSFRQKRLFSNLNFKFNGPGIVFIEGENASGKTSLLKLFAGFAIPSDGLIRYQGISVNLHSVKKRSYLATTSLGLLSELTGQEQIELIARAMGIELVDLKMKIEKFKTNALFNEILSLPISNYSQGMKQLLRLFIHFLPSAEVFFLDEPFLYLSPANRKFIQSEIEHIARDSLVFITDQRINWEPHVKYSKLTLDVK